MDNKEAIEELRSNKTESGWEFMCGECPVCDCNDCELNQALDLAIKALEEVEELEKENHRNFVNSQHIISLLIEENKKLRGEEE